MTSEVRVEGEIVQLWAYYDPTKEEEKEEKEGIVKEDIEFDVYKVKNEVKTLYQVKALVIQCDDEAELKRMKSS